MAPCGGLATPSPNVTHSISPASDRTSSRVPGPPIQVPKPIESGSISMRSTCSGYSSSTCSIGCVLTAPSAVDRLVQRPAVGAARRAAAAGAVEQHHAPGLARVGVDAGELRQVRLLRAARGHEVGHRGGHRLVDRVVHAVGRDRRRARGRAGVARVADRSLGRDHVDVPDAAVVVRDGRVDVVEERDRGGRLRRRVASRSRRRAPAARCR